MSAFTGLAILGTLGCVDEGQPAGYGLSISLGVTRATTVGPCQPITTRNRAWYTESFHEVHKQDAMTLYNDHDGVPAKLVFAFEDEGACRLLRGTVAQGNIGPPMKELQRSLETLFKISDDAWQPNDVGLEVSPSRNERPPQVVSADLQKHVGKTIRVTGVAENARSGAVVLVDGAPIYCSNLEEWSDDVLRQSVEVEGVLEHGVYLPQAVDGPERVAGAKGPSYRFRVCDYHLLTVDQ